MWCVRASADPKPTLDLETGTGRAVDLVWAPNSKTVVGACNDGSVLVWSASTGSVFAALNGGCAAGWPCARMCVCVCV